MDYFANENSVFLFLDFLFLVLLSRKNKSWSILTPSVFFPSIILGMIILGNINLLFFQKVVGWYVEINAFEGNRVALISLFALIMVLFFAPYKKKISTNPFFFKPRKFRIVLVSLGLIALLLNIYNYYSIGGLVILKSNLLGSERFDTLSALPFPKALNLSSFLICPLILQVVGYSRKRGFFVGLLIAQILLAFGLGQRHMVFMPCIVALIFLIATNVINRKFIWIPLAGLPFLILLASFARGDGDNLMFTSSEALFGGEYRDFLRQRNENIPLYYGKTMVPLVLNAIPQQLFSIIGLEKDEFRIYSPYIVADTWGNSSGQRTGIWGEFYLNFGDIGIILGFVIIALIIILIERKLFVERWNYHQKFLFAYFYSLIIFSIIGAWGTIGDDLGTNGFLYLFVYKICFQKPKQVLS